MFSIFILLLVKLIFVKDEKQFTVDSFMQLIKNLFYNINSKPILFIVVRK
jgi:hypothetical protein